MADRLTCISLLASFSSCVYGCGLVVCMQDSSGEKLVVESIMAEVKIDKTSRNFLMSNNHCSP